MLSLFERSLYTKAAGEPGAGGGANDSKERGGKNLRKVHGRTSIVGQVIAERGSFCHNPPRAPVLPFSPLAPQPASNDLIFLVEALGQSRRGI